MAQFGGTQLFPQGFIPLLAGDGAPQDGKESPRQKGHTDVRDGRSVAGIREPQWLAHM